MKSFHSILAVFVLGLGCGGDDGGSSTGNSDSSGDTATTGDTASTSASTSGTTMDSASGTTDSTTSNGTTDSTTTGTSTETTTGSTDGGTAGSSGGESMGEATGGAGLTCTECADMSCGTEVTACTGDTDCNCVWTCLPDSNPGQCQNTCDVNSNSNMPLSDLFDCLDLSCGAAC